MKHRLKIVSIIFLSCISTLNAHQTIRPEDESSFWKWSPWRMTSHFFRGKEAGQDFWEANSSTLNADLANFTATKNTDAQEKILTEVMRKVYEPYQRAMDTLQANYNDSLQYVLSEFKKSSPKLTIIPVEKEHKVFIFDHPLTQQDLDKIHGHSKSTITISQPSSSFSLSLARAESHHIQPVLLQTLPHNSAIPNQQITIHAPNGTIITK